MMNALEGLRQRINETPGGLCLIGFSGGADSTALIRILAAEREKGRIVPEAVHVNHGIRGADSDADEEFCRTVCRELDIPIICARAELNGRKDENACREERFRLFRQIMDAHGIRELVLAHNMDDLAETLLMRLMRGAGLEGLDCMSSRDEWNDMIVLRPMIHIGREEIRNAMRKDGYEWREDGTNRTGVYLRNNVRTRIIPLMEEMAPGSVERIARTAEILTLENRMLQKDAESFLNAHSSRRIIDAEALKQIPEAMRRRVLRLWWKQETPQMEEHALNGRQTAELTALVEAEKGKANMPGGLYAVRGQRTIHLTGLPEEKREEIPYRREPIRIGDITLLTMRTEGNPGDGIEIRKYLRNLRENAWYARAAQGIGSAPLG